MPDTINFQNYMRFSSPDQTDATEQQLRQTQDNLIQKKIDVVPYVVTTNASPATDRALPDNGWKPETPLGDAVFRAGFAYDYLQDIIYSTMDNYQRKLGYCRMYDDTAIGISSVIDSEPIYFSDDKYEWMIELWKGQYGLETGGEIGVYRRKKNAPKTAFEKLNGKLYECVPNDSLLKMSFELFNKGTGKSLLSRGPEEHWWLTGFKWGVFSNPDDIRMDATITFKDTALQNAFIKAMNKLNYQTTCTDNTCAVSFRFDHPASKQPKTRDALFAPIQKVNTALVNNFLKLKSKLNISSNDPNEIDTVITKSGSDEEKMIYHWMTEYFKKRHTTG